MKTKTSDRFLTPALIMFLAAVAVKAAVPIAGIYEMDAHPDLSKHQMYLELDFINSRPDFTQTFTDKKSEFKYLPSDFMNAKKLKQTFKGTTAPGFGKYRQKTLFNTTEEFRITNPRSKKGIVLVDWENTDGIKGEAIIIPQPDGALITYGLTALDRLLSPDGFRLELVKSLLPGEISGNAYRPYDKPELNFAEFAESIKTGCTGDFPGTLERLHNMPDDPVPGETPDNNTAGSPTEPGVSASTASDRKSDSGSKPTPEENTFNTLVSNDGKSWKSNGVFKFDNTSVVRTDNVDFWEEEDGVIAMRLHTQAAPGDCKVYDFEHIYYGRAKGNTVVFTTWIDTLKSGSSSDHKPVPIPESECRVLTITSPTTFTFDRMKFNKL